MFASMTGKNFAYGIIGGVVSEAVFRWIEILPSFMFVPMVIIAVASIGGAVFAYSAASQYDTQNIWPSRRNGEFVLTIAFVTGVTIFASVFYFYRFFFA